MAEPGVLLVTQPLWQGGGGRSSKPAAVAQAQPPPHQPQHLPFFVRAQPQNSTGIVLFIKNK